jgi:hypothetical protein
MQQFVSEKLWSLITKHSKRGAKAAAIAYVTSDKHIAFGRGDLLVTDASDAAITGGRTSAKVLKKAYATGKGARLYSLNTLHAKVLCLGRYVVIGSANASNRSARNLVEAGVVSDDPGLRAQARVFVEQLTDSATVIDAAFIKRILALPVDRPPPVPRAERPKLRDSSASRTWLVGVSPLKESRYRKHRASIAHGKREAKAEVAKKTSGVSWLLFSGNSRFRRLAKPGDSVIQLWRDDADSKAPEAYFSVPILRRQDEEGCTILFIEELRKGREISWRDFRNNWKQVVGGVVPSIRCVRALRDDVATMLNASWSMRRGG